MNNNTTPHIVNNGVIKTDTITVRDTLEVPIPVPVIRYKEKIVKSKPILKTDTLIMPLGVSLSDSIKRYEYTYQTKEYKAVISGYEPKLDYIEVYPITKTVTKIIKPKKWSVVATFGYGVCGNTSGVVIGVGIGYTLFRF